MRRVLPSLAFTVAVTSATLAWSQIAAPPRVGSQPSAGNQGLRDNTVDAGEPAAIENKIVQPLPLSATEKENALASIDRHLTTETAKLKEKLVAVLPDELAVLAKTSGWAAEDQQKLLAALRAVDAAAVFTAWSKGDAKDPAGAELAARQTDVRRLMAKLEQDVEKNKASLHQDLKEFDDALTKLNASTPAVADLRPFVDKLNNWVEARKLVDAAVPAKGSVAHLPQGKVKLIYDPSLKKGTAIVLSKEAMLIGDEGAAALRIVEGNAAQALGLPIVTGSPIADAEGQPADGDILILNPTSTKTTINYNLNGDHFLSEPGMAQRLPNDRPWVVEFDRGNGFGKGYYKLTPGTYEFEVTDRGLQFYVTRYDVVLDNSQSGQEFAFLFQGENLTVPAGGTKKLESMYPIVVRFDRGNGAKFVSKQVNFSGNVQIGVNAEDNLWDLFPTTDNQREVATLKLFQNR